MERRQDEGIAEIVAAVKSSGQVIGSLSLRKRTAWRVGHAKGQAPRRRRQGVKCLWRRAFASCESPFAIVARQQRRRGGQLAAGHRHRAEAAGQVPGVARRDRPRSIVERARQARGSARPAGASPWLVHRRPRHAVPQGGEGVAGRSRRLSRRSSISGDAGKHVITAASVTASKEKQPDRAAAVNPSPGSLRLASNEGQTCAVPRRSLSGPPRLCWRCPDRAMALRGKYRPLSPRSDRRTTPSSRRRTAPAATPGWCGNCRATY